MREKFVSILLPILLSHRVLSTLSNIQRSFDPLDIEGLSKLCTGSSTSEYPNKPLPLPTSLKDPTLKEWRSFLDKIKDTRDHTNPDKCHERHYLLAYLLSATFKDCSIIIRPHGDEPAGAGVTIIDLDAKSLERLRRWEALDREVLLASKSEEKICVDGQASLD